jgi:hypothetical protein
LLNLIGKSKSSPAVLIGTVPESAGIENMIVIRIKRENPNLP